MLVFSTLYSLVLFLSFQLLIINPCNAWVLRISSGRFVCCFTGREHHQRGFSRPRPWFPGRVLQQYENHLLKSTATGIDDSYVYTFKSVREEPYVSDVLKFRNNETEPGIRTFFRLSLQHYPLHFNDELDQCLYEFLLSDKDFHLGLSGQVPQVEAGSISSTVTGHFDPLWEQVRMEAQHALTNELMAGPQLYQGILSQPSLLSAVCSIIANEIATELMPATAIKTLMLSQLSLNKGDRHEKEGAYNVKSKEENCIQLDVMASATRSTSIGNALSAVLFCKGLHALVCYRVAHRLWSSGRVALAKYMQSTVSRKYAVDIHPAAQIGAGVFLGIGTGIVIGETATVGDDVTIMQGVTLGGTGKESGDRHPKVGSGVILYDSCTVLGNIPIGDGAVVMPKSIVTKPVPALSCVSGVPAKLQPHQKVIIRAEASDREAKTDWVGCAKRHLRKVYQKEWETQKALEHSGQP